MRVGEVDRVVLASHNDHSVSINMPSLSGDYRLSGNLLQGTNEFYGYNSDWEDKGGWMELSGGPGIGGPQTAVVRLQDSYIRGNVLNVTGYASENVTIKIVSSPNDLTQRTIDSDGFVPRVIPLDTPLNYTAERLVSTQWSVNDPQLPSSELVECAYVSYRTYRCHNFAYSAYPASVTTDFYTKDCDNAIKGTATIIGSYPNRRYVNIPDDVETGHTKGVWDRHDADGSVLEWVPVTLDMPPVIECGPRVNGFQHVTKIELNQTDNYNEQYWFGPNSGTYDNGDFYQKIRGNMSLLDSDHHVYFEGTGMFEETIDLNNNFLPSHATTVTVDLTLGTSNVYSYYMLEAPDGQEQVLCGLRCGNGLVTYTATFSPTDITGDWQLYGKRWLSSIAPVDLHGWKLTFNGAEHHASTLNTAYNPPSTTYTVADTITIKPAPYTIGSNSLYLVATGMNATGKTAVIRASDQAFDAPLAIRNMPPYAPYVITDDGNILKIGMADSSGRIDFPHAGLGANLTGPIVFKYWPNSLTYVGNHHAVGKSILFDTYNDRVISFPWDPNDPLLYVVRAYVKMTIPVDGMSLDEIRLVNKVGQYVSYPYLTGTYDAGDEVYVPIFPATTEIHLQINGDWVQSYVKDVQQNSHAKVFSGLSDSVQITNAPLSKTATMFVTQPGSVIALVSVESTGSAQATLATNYSSWPDRLVSALAYCNLEKSNGVYMFDCPSSTCRQWERHVNDNRDLINEYRASVDNARQSIIEHAGISVIAYKNGQIVETSLTTKPGFTDPHVSIYEHPYVWRQPLEDCEFRPLTGGYLSGGVWSNQPWQTSSTITIGYTDESFSQPVVVDGVEPGDQIDFVITIGVVLGDVESHLLDGMRYTLTSDSDIKLGDGYIIMYQ